MKITAKERNARRMHRQCFEQITQREARADTRRKEERKKSLEIQLHADLDNVIKH